MLAHPPRTRFAGLSRPQRLGGRDHRPVISEEKAGFAGFFYGFNCIYLIYTVTILYANSPQPASCRQWDCFPFDRDETRRRGRQYFEGRSRGPRPRRRREVSKVRAVAGDAVGQRPSGEVLPAPAAVRQPTTPLNGGQRNLYPGFSAATNLTSKPGPAIPPGGGLRRPGPGGAARPPTAAYRPDRRRPGPRPRSGGCFPLCFRRCGRTSPGG